MTKQHPANSQSPRPDADAGAPEITPAMLGVARSAFQQWMQKWDYLADGLPASAEVDELLASVIVGAFREQIGAQ